MFIVQVDLSNFSVRRSGHHLSGLIQFARPLRRTEK